MFFYGTTSVLLAFCQRFAVPVYKGSVSSSPSLLDPSSKKIEDPERLRQEYQLVVLQHQYQGDHEQVDRRYRRQHVERAAHRFLISYSYVGHKSRTLDIRWAYAVIHCDKLYIS